MGREYRRREIVREWGGSDSYNGEASWIGALRKSHDLCDGDILKGTENEWCEQIFGLITQIWGSYLSLPWFQWYGKNFGIVLPLMGGTQNAIFLFFYLKRLFLFTLILILLLFNSTYIF